MKKARIKETLKLDSETTILENTIVDVNDDHVCESENGCAIIELFYHNMSYLIPDQKVEYIGQL